MKRGLLLFLAVYGATLGVFWATSVTTMTLYPTVDSYSWQSVPNANNGGSDNFEITSSIANPKNMRGWIAFDVRRLPSDALIIGARLTLRIWHKTTNSPKEGIGDSTGRIYAVYRVTQPWAEYNVTWANQPNYTDAHHATAAVPNGQGGWEGPLLYMDWDLREILNDWRSGANNYGVLVRDTQENSQTLYSTQFFTHDHVPGNIYYPRLIVTYVKDQAVAILIAALALEGLFIIVMSRMKRIPFKNLRKK